MPSDTLRALEGGASDLLRLDAGLVHALDAAGPEVQRAVALLAARRASEAAGPAGLRWVAPALTALAEERPLPAPFDDWDRMRQALWSDPQAPDGVVGEAIPPPGSARPVRGMAVTARTRPPPHRPGARNGGSPSPTWLFPPCSARAGPNRCGPPSTR
ncbi:hypothetical protein SUDANB105_00244 [Streptomyces sp. enrichment culture]